MDPYKIHGLTSDIDYVSSDSGESDFDEEYWRLKPPPLKISERNVMVILPRGIEKKIADKQLYSTVLRKNISKNKLTNNFHTAINTQNLFGAPNGMNSKMKKKRSGGKQRRIADRSQKGIISLNATQKNVQIDKEVKDIFSNTLHSVNISNDSVHSTKIKPHVHKTVHSLDVQNDSSKRKKRRRRRNSKKIQSLLQISNDRSLSFENVENTTTTKTSQSISVLLRNTSELKSSEIFTLTKTLQKVGSTNDCTKTKMLELMPPQFSEQENSSNILQNQLQPRFQEKINSVVEHKNVPENTATDTFFNILDFDYEDIENIYNDDSVYLNKSEHEVIQMKHTSVAHNALNGNHFKNVAITLQEVGLTNHSIETDELLPLQLSEQVKYGNMLKYKKLSRMRNVVLELSSEHFCSETSDLSGVSCDVEEIDRISGLWKNYVFPMPEEPPSYFKQILKYLQSNQNTIILGLTVCYFLKRINKLSITGMLGIFTPLRYRNELNPIYFQRSFHVNNLFG